MATDPVAAGDAVGRRLAGRRRWRDGRSADRLWAGVTAAAGVALVALFAGLVGSLTVGALPALRAFGAGFAFSEAWNPVTEEFGALASLTGTVVTSLLALALAVPVAFGIAVFLSKLCPAALRRPLGIAIELLAAIPSIVYGMWGLFVFAPFLAEHVQPPMTRLIGGLPLVGRLFDGPPIGIGVFTAGLILAVMVLPLIAAVMRDALEATPPLLAESAYALGATTWEVVWKVAVPHARAGLFGAVVLGLGRALGETMAVTFVIGNAHRLNASLFLPGSTISSTLANEFAEATGELHTASLVALGWILFILTALVISLSRILLRRLARRDGARA